MQDIVIDVARDFGEHPCGRTTNDSDVSAERFREELIVPALHRLLPGQKLVIILDTGISYSSTFLYGSFSNLVSFGYFTAEELSTKLILSSTEYENKFFSNRAWKYITDATYNKDTYVPSISDDYAMIYNTSSSVVLADLRSKWIDIDAYVSFMRPMNSEDTPHYDIVNVDDNTIEVIVECTGWDVRDIKVTERNGILDIRTCGVKDSDKPIHTSHKGITELKAFDIQLVLLRHIVHDAHFKSGLLTVILHLPQRSVVNVDIN